MDYLFVAVALAVPALFILGPTVALACSTVGRIQKFKKSGSSQRFQYQISELLTATICLGIVATFMQFIFRESRNSFWFSAYFLAAAGLGLLGGKIWHWSTIKNSLKDGPTYLVVGAVLWLLASIGPAFGFYIINSGVFPHC